nr:pentatricopeptide repeat-containing protein At3g02650, mitochondrial-like [Coffea arabica]
MWRLARKAAFLRGTPKFRKIQNPYSTQVTRSHNQSPPLPDLALFQWNRFTSSVCVKVPYYPSARFFSSNPYLENEDSQSEKPVIDGFDENPGFSFVESNPRWDLVDNPDEVFPEFVFESEKTGDLADNFVGSSAGNDDDDEGGVLDGGDGNAGKTEKIEDMAQKLEDILSLLQSSGDAKSLESSLEDMGLVLNEELVVKVLETPFVPGENLIGFFKWVLKNGQFSITKGAIDMLVRAISNEVKTRDAYALWDLVKEVGGKDIGVLSTETLNELLSMFSRLGKGKAAFEVFNKFEDFGCVPDADTYYFTIDALCRRRIFDWACSVSEKMLNAGRLPDSEKVGKIVSHLCKGKKLKDAHAVYLWAKEGKVYPRQSSVNSLISSLCENEKQKGVEVERLKGETDSHSQAEEGAAHEEKENVYLALKMLDDISGEGLKHAIKPFSSVTGGLCRIKDFEGAKKLLNRMIEAGPPPGYTIFNTIITGLSRSGEMQEAIDTLKMMEERGLKPDVYTYTVIMSGYVVGGAMEEACKVLDEAKKKHSKLSPATYHTLIRGYCKLEQFDKALDLIGEMKNYGVQPNADEYNKLIRSLCMKALDWRTAEKLLEKMRENGLHLNGKTRSLVRAVKELEEEGLASQDVPTAA